ncbi:MAG TPA: Wzz/FepE/Etk N-terminal domain-containing protein, partial [Acidimicrobiales bacterium]|nr:Wzz/FepE/Etk N-terminal domain-containing protein [Acidimicrobiales bacterium]
MLPLGPPEDDELELRDYLVVLRRRWVTVVATVVATVVVALAVSFLQTPVYEASATLLLQSRTSEQIFAPESQTPARTASDVLTEIGVMESRSIRQAVTEELGRPVEVSIQAEGETDLVTVSAESTDPAAAAEVANTYAEVYITTRRQQLVADLQTAMEQVQTKITQIERQIDQADQPLDELATQRAQLESQQEPYITQLGQLQ